MNIDIYSPEFWEERWAKACADSFLKSTQKSAPNRWKDFFNQVSDIYSNVWGDSHVLGHTLTDFFFSEKLIGENSRVLDMGSGPGTLTIPLAQRCTEVLAIDQAENMLAVLEKEAARQDLKNVKTLCRTFEMCDSDLVHDLAVAAFFPPALEPEGLIRLENLSRKYCAVIIGTSGESIPFRKELWQKIMDVPLQSGVFHLISMVGWLLAKKRQPNMKHFSIPSRFSFPLEDMIRFFKSYFSIFGYNDISAQETICNVLTPHAVKGCIAADIQINIVVVWWQKIGVGC